METDGNRKKLKEREGKIKANNVKVTGLLAGPHCYGKARYKHSLPLSERNRKRGDSRA
jgi:hypothetical protein